MFSIFKKKKTPAVVYQDLVYQKVETRRNALLKEIGESKPPVVLIFHFPEERVKIQELLRNENRTYYDASLGVYPGVLDAHPLVLIDTESFIQHRDQLPAVSVLVPEHHPQWSKDEKLLFALEKLPSLKKLRFFVALEEPFMGVFGSERIIGLIQKMGMKEEECIEHTLVLKSIQNAQKKMDKITYVLPADSQEAWIRKNKK